MDQFSAPLVTPSTSEQLSFVNSERYEQLLTGVCNNSAIQHLVISFPVSIKDPIEWFKANKGSFAFNYYWEKPSTSFAIAALGSLAELSAVGNGRFDTLQYSFEQVNKHSIHFNASLDDDLDIHFVGGFSFFNKMNSAAWKNFNPACLTIPKYAVIKNEGIYSASIAIAVDKGEDRNKLHNKILAELHFFTAASQKSRSSISSVNQPIPSPKEFSIDTEYRQWKNLVSKAREQITKNRFQKVVLGRQRSLSLPSAFDSIAALRYLRSLYPGCYTFLIKYKDSNTFIGSTPETLLSIKGNNIQTEALAGSIARGKTHKGDRKLENELLKSMKNHEEHRYVIKELKNVLAPFVNHINSAKRPQIKKLSNVQHLYTPVEGILNKKGSPLSLIGQLHPTPAVGGTPRKEALRYINKREPFERGWFASPVGWVSSNKNAQFGVSIRSGLISENRALLFAGCGIVEESNPESEWHETNLKFRPMLSALNYD